MIVSVKRTSANDPDFRQLVELLDKDLWRRYPDTQDFFTPFNVIKEDGKVVVAYVDGSPAGCGCFRGMDDRKTVEIKRMYVKDEVRGKGIGKRIVGELEAWALEEGKTRAVLETGRNQPEAVALYKKLGYEETERYGPYVDSEASICMGKTLSVK